MRATILSIEDQADIRRLIRMALEFKGYCVIEADDGAGGIQLAKARQPDLILMDVMMPGLDGISASRMLAEDPETAHIPIVMLSALGRTSDIDAGLETGVKAYLVKPFSPWELIALVGELTQTLPTSSPVSSITTE